MRKHSLGYLVSLKTMPSPSPFHSWRASIYRLPVINNQASRKVLLHLFHFGIRLREVFDLDRTLQITWPTNKLKPSSLRPLWLRVQTARESGLQPGSSGVKSRVDFITRVHMHTVCMCSESRFVFNFTVLFILMLTWPGKWILCPFLPRSK